MNKRRLRPDKRGNTEVAKNLEKLWNKEEAKLGEKISLNQLAGDIGIAQSILWRIYTGESVDPKDATIAPIAEHFEVSIPQLRGHVDLRDVSLSTSARARMLARKIDQLSPTARKALIDLLEVLLAEQQAHRKIV